MKQISRETLTRIAHLARLRLSPEEVAQYTRELSAVLEAMEALQRVTVAKFAPDDLPPLESTAAAEDERTTRPSAPLVMESVPDRAGEFVRLKGGTFDS